MSEIDEKVRDRTPERKKASSLVEVPHDAITLLNKQQVAAILNLHVRVVDSLVSSGGYPPHDLLINKRKRWKVQTHNAWVDAQCESKGEPHGRRVQAS